MFLGDGTSLLRPLLVGVFAYAGLVLFLRVSGKRTLGKMDAFDLVVTVAVGSVLATVLLSRDVALAEGLVGFAVLILLQFVVTWLSVRSAAVRRLVRAEPTLLFYGGKMLPDALTDQRVTESEVLQAVRATGAAGLDQVVAVVLESDGSFSVVRRGSGSGSALRDVPGAGEPGGPEGRPATTPG